MPVVYNTLNVPGGDVARRAKVRLQLIASTTVDNSPGWVDATDVTILSTTAPTVDSAGYWSATLTGNADITPANSVYRVT